MPAFVIGGSALVGAGGSIFSSLLGASGTSKSAAAIRYAADQASKTALELNARSRADLKPFRDLGVQSGQMLSDIYSGKANLDQLFKSSSLYQFESDYGTRALNRQLVRGASTIPGRDWRVSRCLTRAWWRNRAATISISSLARPS